MTRWAAVTARARHNFGLKALALGLASLAFLYAHGEQSREGTFVTPVEYLLPPDLVLLNDEPLPDRVVVVASGTRAMLSQVQETQLSYVVDLEAAVAGTSEYSFRTPPSGFPDRLRISTVSPAMIRLRFDERERRIVPVQLRVRGNLPAGFVETSRSISPPEVLLVGARSELSELESIQTMPLNIELGSGAIDRDLALDTTGLHLLPESVNSVRVTIAVEEVVAEREFGTVPLVFEGELAGRGGLTLRPPSALLRVRGPLPILDGLRPGSLQIAVLGSIGALPDVGGELSIKHPEKAPAPPAAFELRLRIDHPRSERVEWVSVDPKSFVLAVGPAAPAVPAGGSAP